MRVVGLVLATGLVSRGAFGLACRLRLGRRVDVLLAGATLATFQVVVTVLFAGLVVRRLSPWVLSGSALAVSGPLVWLTRHELRPGQWVHAIRQLRVRRIWMVVRGHPWASVLAIAALGQLLWRAVISYAVPPYGWDALWYHLTTVATWVTAGRITFVPYGLWSNIFPADAEVITAWVATFTHTSVGLTGMQLPFGVLGALAVMSLARTVGVSRSGAVGAGSLFFLTPVVLTQTTSNYVDLTAAALVLTALAFALRLVTVGNDDSGLRWRLAMLCGIAGGLAIGTKTTSVAYVGLIGVVLAVSSLRVQGRELSRSVWTLGAFAVPVLLLGGFWYARIWAHYGSPVHPFAVKLGSVHLFDGPAKASTYIEKPPPRLGGSVLVQPLRSWWYDLVTWRWRPGSGQYTYDQRIGGFGPVWLLLEVPLYAGLAWIAARRRNGLLLLLVLLPLVGFALQPYRWWTRFTMPLLAPGVIALVLGVEKISRQMVRRLLLCFSGGLVVMSAALASLHLVMLPGTELRAKDIAHRALHPSLAARSSIPADQWLEGLGRDESIAVECDPYAQEFYFPLFGSHLSHRLVPISSTDPDSLISDLRASRTSVLVAIRGSYIDRWAEADPHHFKRLGEPPPTGVIRKPTLSRAYRFEASVN
jgi:hypothetical protein